MWKYTISINTWEMLIQKKSNYKRTTSHRSKIKSLLSAEIQTFIWDWQQTLID